MVVIRGTDLRSWSAKPEPPAGMLGLGSMNWNTASGYPRRDRGYKRLRQIQSDPPSAFNKGGGSWTHRDVDGTQYPFYWFNGAWYRETGSGATSLESGLGDYFCPSVGVCSAPGGVSVGVVGTNSKARGFRVEGGNLAIFAWEMAAPTGSLALSSAPTTGGSLSDGTYNVVLTQIDDTGARTVESGPVATLEVVLSGGTSTQRIILDLTGLTYATRATKFRVYLSVGGDSATAYFQTGADTAKATTTFTISSTTVGTAIPQRAGIYQKAEFAIDGVDSVVEWMGRIVYASSSSPYVGWSERSDVNHYYSTNLTDQVEGEMLGPVTALGATADALYIFTADAVHMLTGDFGRDEDGFPMVNLRTIDKAIGCVSRASVVPVPNVGLFFMSQHGPCVCAGGTVVRLLHDDVADLSDRLDYTYADRWTGAYDTRLRAYVCAVTRKTNTNWIPDGAANAGICDWLLRFNLDEGTLSPPQHVEVTHLSQRPAPSSPGTTSYKSVLTAAGPHGSILELHHSRAGGITGDVSGSAYSAILATSPLAASCVIAGTGYGNLEGASVLLRYPSTDTAYPNALLQRTIKSRSEAGGNTTLNWEGNVPVPTGTAYSVRVGGMRRHLVLRALSLSEDPMLYTRHDHTTVVEVDEVGHEARA